MIHLDSDIAAEYLRGNKRVAARLKAALPDVAISTIVLMELRYGAYVSARTYRNLQQIAGLLSLAPSVPFDESCASACAQIRAHLRGIGRPTGEADALIAATAVAHNATLVTHNTRHYENIPNLRLEDWLL